MSTSLYIYAVFLQLLAVSADVYIGKDCEDMYWYYWQRDRVQMDSGIKTIWPVNSPDFFEIYCEVEQHGIIWNWIQNRLDGAVRFDDSFEGYRDGFGNGLEASSEFWLGNDKIHYLTSQAEYSIRFDLGDADGREDYADYNFFGISGEDDNYRLNLGSFVEGDAGDSMFNNSAFGDQQSDNHNNQQFSTLDNDNDKAPTDPFLQAIGFKFSCADKNGGGGGWWYDACDNANLNGKYFSDGSDQGDDIGIEWVSWDRDKRDLSLVKTRMKLKRKSGFRINLVPDQF